VIGVWTIFATYAILKAMNAFTSIRVSEEAESEGLDIHEHNENGYSL
jgi:ammonia channel protein AmtB